MNPTRRVFVAAGVLASGVGAKAAESAGRLQPTPAQMIGPFYPVVRPPESTADLTRMPGKSGRARGDLIEVLGTVLSAAGKPVRGAMVLVWQANSDGRYDHPRDSNTARLDENFRGHALLRTDSSGNFRLRTIKPGAYADTPGVLRTPHIHYEVIGEESRLITQMYFPNEPLNPSDRLLREMARGGRDAGGLIARPARPAMSAGATAYEWTVVLGAS